MPRAVRAGLPTSRTHSELSLFFAKYSSERCSDDWFEWVSPTPALDSQLKDALLSYHAEERFHERWGENRRVELHRSLFSGNGGSYRAICRTTRVELLVNGVRLVFSWSTGRLIDHSSATSLRGCAEGGKMSSPLVNKLTAGVNAAVAGTSPSYRIPLDQGVRSAALSALEASSSAEWCTLSRLIAVTTTASLVLEERPVVPAGESQSRQLSLITLLPCGARETFASWKRTWKRAHAARDKPLGRHRYRTIGKVGDASFHMPLQHTTELRISLFHFLFYPFAVQAQVFAAPPT